MVVESELLYTVYLIMYIVPFIRNDTLVNAFVQGPSVIQVCPFLSSILSPRPSYTLSQSVSALMIVYRIADGKGWSSHTYAEATTQAVGGDQLANVTTLGVAQATTFGDVEKAAGSMDEV